MKSRSLFKWFLIGAFSGYFVIHPIFMSVGHLMHQDNIYTEHSLHAVIFNSFSFHMIPWGFMVAFVCGLLGYLYQRIRLNEGLLRNAKMELERKVEERTEELLKVNQGLRGEIIERKKAEDALIERARQAELGAEIGAVLVKHDDLRSLLQLCTESIVKHLDAAFARIWVFNEKKNVLELMASAGMYTHIDGNHLFIPVGKSKISRIAQEKKPHLTNEVIGDPQISDQEWAKREGMIAFAGHPLVVADKLVGVMAMFSKKPLQEMTLKALASISDEIALGIERKKSEDQINFLAYYDSLTSLPNRYYFKELLERTIEYANRYKKSFTIALIDLDDFNRINDTLGHNIGDDFLKSVSSRLLSILRTSDFVARISDEEKPVARMGGDEFIVLLQELVDVATSSHVMHRLLKELSQPYELDGREVFITASIGISKYPDDGEDTENLIKNADTALYHAKRKGKNSYQFYSKSMNEAALELLTMENNLRRALEQQEFLLYYQPKMDLSTRQIIGMEALIRWKQSDGNLISPAKFIPIAEASGLIVPIGEFVLRTACLQNKMWQEAGLKKISVAVNVSGLQFGQKDFVKDTFTALEDTDLNPQYLELEITETTIMTNPERAIRNLNELKEAGIQISIDDFGTGYSSLNYLRRLPLDAMKIDISFIRNVVTDLNDAVIVKTIIAMAHNLNLKVIAEGVEDEQQFEFLKEHKCDAMQGYLLSPPVPTEEFPNLLTA
ncbi:MAG: EAL domain-containing protein [Desulfobacterales bacterium]|nr:EAL domain-containing protein [Desulfobacterales bacterium]